jgi:outer membrane lipoprotein-sorting protein
MDAWKRWMLTMVVLMVPGMVCAAAEPKSADEVLAFASNRVESLHNWQADFRLSDHNPKGQETRLGRMTFKEPNLVRVQTMVKTSMGNGMRLVVMGEDLILWNALVIGEGRAQTGKKGSVHTFRIESPWRSISKVNVGTVIQKAKDKAGAGDVAKRLIPGREWELTKEYQKWKMLPDAIVDKQPVWVIEGKWRDDLPMSRFAKSQSIALSGTKLYVSKKDGSVLKVVQTYKRNPALTRITEIVNIEVDREAAADFFKYEPPEDMLPVIEDETRKWTE